MNRTHPLSSSGFALVLASIVSISAALAAAPRSKDIMQPVDTSPGAFSDPNRMLQASLDRTVSISVENQPALVVYNQLHAYLNVDFGYAKDVDENKLVTFKASAPGLEVLKSFGKAASVRFEVTGPIQIRVLAASAAPLHKTPKEPPPVKMR